MACVNNVGVEKEVPASGLLYEKKRITALVSPLAKSKQKPARQSADSPRDPILLHEFFEQAAQRWPGNIAIETPPGATRTGRRTITYHDLNEKADALARLLRTLVQDECVVAIMLPRDSEHLYLAQLAILKAGAAYACIDPSCPDEQAADILRDSRAVAVLTNAGGAVRARSLQADLELALDLIAWDNALDAPIDALPAPSWLNPSSLAYVIYTSGTTGRPKGVMIEHGSITNLIRGDCHDLAITPRDRVGQVSASVYDASVEEIWMTLTTGATLIVMDDDTTHLGPDLVPWLRRERITVFSPAPTVLRMTGCDDPAQALPDLRLLYVGGEALPQDVAERWSRGKRFINGYGPTECTVTALRADIHPGGPIIIGTPVPGLHALVLNDQLDELPAGEQGELCLAGIGLARGYMNDAALTALKFPEYPLFGRIYRTGDLVHRDAEGNFHCQGRIDAQVKIRGYRIELEAIEARLAECPGVREAACCVQGEGNLQKIAAFLVPSDAAAPPSFADLKASLRNALPEYMVPTLFGIVDELPRSVSGKLNRKALPTLHVDVEAGMQRQAPRNAVEEQLAAAVAAVLRLPGVPSVHDDFFHDLGGDSLLAAQLISALRNDSSTALLAVRDLYNARTIAALAQRIPARTVVPVERKPRGVRPVGSPRWTTLAQTLWLALHLLIAAPITYLLAYDALPEFTEKLGLIPSLLLAPFVFGAGVGAYLAATVALAVLAKKILMGRYVPVRAPVWGGFYLRNWIVQHTVRMIPWTYLEGTMLQIGVLRLLGARIGARVHIHHGVNLLDGGWDLLDIGNDVTLSQDSTVGLVELIDGQIVVGPVAIGDGCTLDVRAGVTRDSVMEADSFLTPLSLLGYGCRLPRGERWDGIPARPAGQAPGAKSPGTAVPGFSGELSPGMHALALGLGRGAVALFVNLPTLLLVLAVTSITGLDADSALHWLFDSSVHLVDFLLAIMLVFAHVPLTLLASALAMRLMGEVPEGVVSRWSLAYVRVWLKTGLLTSANGWLLGSLFWPIWLRAAGMKIGPGCEMSSLIDTVPDLVEVGANSFFADGIYLAGPKVHRGTVTLAKVRMGNEIFLGNNVMIAVGQTIPDGVLLGISTVADGAKLAPNTSWFGQPPFELPKREIIACERDLTHTPKWLRLVNRLFWDCLRFTLPLAPVFLIVAWFKLIALAEDAVSLPVLLFGVVPVLDFAFLASLCLMGLALKWALLGRVKPGVHPLYSCWCSRWEFHYVAWDLFVNSPLSALEGTLLLNWFLRAMGMKIGRNVMLAHGAAGMIDHDMMDLEDGATVSCMFQAHTFEDRVLKIDYVKVRAIASVGQSAVLLYGADIGAGAVVLPHSVVMKHEKLLPDTTYAGCPTQVVS